MGLRSHGEVRHQSLQVVADQRQTGHRGKVVLELLDGELMHCRSGSGQANGLEQRPGSSMRRQPRASCAHPLGEAFPS